MTPKISIIMPVLNGERYIAEAIGSICSQTYTRYELVVIDDGSTDRTREIVQSFEARLDLKYVHHARCLGIAPSMNDGVRNASGAFITFLDHDDLWFPEFLQTQLSYLMEHAEVGMVHSDIQTIDSHGEILEASAKRCRQRAQPSGHVFRDLFMHSMICGNSVMIRRECFDRLGLFDESLRWGDYLMWMRIARHYRIDYVDQVLTKYRQHPTQSTRDLTADPPAEPPPALKAIERVLELYPEIRQELGERTIRRRVASFYFDQAYRWFTSDQPASARLCLRRALRLWPTNPRYLSLYGATLLGPAQRSAGRQLWRRVSGRQAETSRAVRSITS